MSGATFSISCSCFQARKRARELAMEINGIKNRLDQLAGANDISSKVLRATILVFSVVDM